MGISRHSIPVISANGESDCEPRSHWRKGSAYAPVSPAVTSPFTANFRTARLQCVHLAWDLSSPFVHITPAAHPSPRNPPRLGNGLDLSSPCSPGRRGWEPTPRPGPTAVWGAVSPNGTSDLCAGWCPLSVDVKISGFYFAPGMERGRGRGAGCRRKITQESPRNTSALRSERISEGRAAFPPRAGRVWFHGQRTETVNCTEGSGAQGVGKAGLRLLGRRETLVPRLLRAGSLSGCVPSLFLFS